MTYWYPGVQDAVRLSKKVHPNVPVILGGIYAKLCEEHAVQCSGADTVVSKQGLPAVCDVLEKNGIAIPHENPDAATPAYPAFDLLSKIHYICLMTSSGCPFRCHYCASHFLFPEFIQRDPGEVLEEILYWHRKWGIRDFAFYDDALLVSSETHMGVLLERIARLDLPIRFHTPNAIHVREITKPMANLLYRTGFQTIRLGLEASPPFQTGHHALGSGRQAFKRRFCPCHGSPDERRFQPQADRRLHHDGIAGAIARCRRRNYSACG